MKTILTIIASLFLLQSSFGQQGQPVWSVNPYPKTISVTGSAEMEIIPDEIFVQITLGEYQKKGTTQKSLEKIKEEFLANCRAAGIPDSLISIASYSGFHDYYSRKKKKEGTDLLAQISYQVRFSGSAQMDELVSRLDDEATRSFQIVSVSHSRIAELRKQLKIAAVRAAREKGIYLSEAAGEQLGEAITINEPVEWNPVPFNAGYSNIALQSRAADNNTEMDFKKIKIRYDISVVFALK